jgi:hypothetical protein
MIKKVFGVALSAWLALGAVSSFAAAVTFPSGVTECTYGVGTFVDGNGAITVLCDTKGSLKAKLIDIPATGCNTYNKVDVTGSGEITITCRGILTAQTITWVSTAPTVTVGSTGSVSATASSGLAVTFTSTTQDICTVSGSTVTGIAVGTCTLVANQAGDSSYSAAPQATQNINVTAAPIRKAQFTTGGSSGCTYSSVIADVNGFTITCSTKTGTPTATLFGKDVCTYPAASVDMNGSLIILCSGEPKLAQAITFGTAPTVAIGETETLIATASSGLAVTFASSTLGICTVSGSTVTGKSAGECTITADREEDSVYKKAPQMIQKFTVTAVAAPKTQTITFGTEPAVVVGRTGTVSATASSGLAVTFSSLSQTCSVSGSTVTGISMGGCTIAANQAGNSSFSPAPQVTTSFNIAKQTQTITFDPKPTITVTGSGRVSATASSGLLVTFSSLTTGICTVAGNTVTGIAAGYCTIAANQPGDSTYAAASQQSQKFCIGTIGTCPKSKDLTPMLQLLSN